MTTIVFLPGLLCDETVWQPQMDAFTRFNINMKFIDYGDADSLPAMANIVAAEVDGQCALVGHSMGGRVALEFARNTPERITRMVLMDTGYLPLAKAESGKQETMGRMALVSMAKKHGMRAMGKHWMLNMIHPEQHKNYSLCTTILDMIESRSISSFVAQQNALLNRPDATPVLNALNCPTLFVTGDHDNWSPFEQHVAMAKLARQENLKLIFNSGHMTTLEQPEQVNESLIQWLV